MIKLAMAAALAAVSTVALARGGFHAGGPGLIPNGHPAPAVNAPEAPRTVSPRSEHEPELEGRPREAPVDFGPTYGCCGVVSSTPPVAEPMPRPYGHEPRMRSRPGMRFHSDEDGLDVGPGDY